MKTKGWGPFRSDWYSICSAHYEYNDSCRMCQAGGWINTWKQKFETIIFKHNPELWMWWANGRKWERPPIFKRK